MLSILLCYKKGHRKNQNQKHKGRQKRKPGESPHALAWGAVLFTHTDVNLHSADPLVHTDSRECNYFLPS